jgi:protocatechuate 3,4-dioxygenase beta subunit
MNHDKPRTHHEHDHDRGLAHDLRRMVALSSRRQALRLFAGASLIPALGCGGDDSTSADGGTSLDSGTGNCANIPEETGGPYPGDGTNGPNVLTQSGIVRSDIRPSFGSLTGTAAGVPLTVELTLVNTSSSCAPLAGYAVYLWHCDRDGNYSLYTITDQNYLRGVQETDASGKVTFTSIFPACYPGRWPHIHFEIYPTLAKASASSNKVRTSQLALPADVCATAFATAGYEQSVRNLTMISLTSDMVFSDGSSLQVATTTGNVTDGYRSTLVVGVAA